MVMGDSGTDRVRIKVFVLSRDRIAYLDKALQSIVSQDFAGFEVVVSDNSERDGVLEMVQNKYPQVKYIRRIPALAVLDHFRIVLGECDQEYAVLFHDDDVMMPGHLARLSDVLDRDPLVAAVGCNALILRDSSLSASRFMRAFSRPITLVRPESLLEPYLGLGPISPPPFPGYMYRSSAISGLYLDASEGGKYADVSFLMKVLGRGSICWISDPLMQYRIHSGNDSGAEDIKQRLVLLRYIFRNSSLTIRSPLVTEFRFSHWIRWILACSYRFDTLRSRKFSVALRFVMLKAPIYILTRPGMRYLITNKIIGVLGRLTR